MFSPAGAAVCLVVTFGSEGDFRGSLLLCSLPLELGVLLPDVLGVVAADFVIDVAE